MSQPVRSAITACEAHHPTKVISNDDLAKTVDTSDEWIRTRTGISKRRRAKESEASSDLAVKAIEKILKKKSIKAEEIDLIIVATITPDTVFPATACVIQDKIGAKNAWGFDLSAACSGFLYGLATADQFIQSGKVKKALVVGVDVMSSIIDPTDRNTCVIFGDGCGAVLLEPVEVDSDLGILDAINRVDGSGAKFLYMPAGGSKKPTTIETVQAKEHFVHQDGKAVFKAAVSEMANISFEILEKNHLSPQDIDFFVPHQANIRIIESCQKKLGLKDEQVILNIQDFGNTTAGTIPSCLALGAQSKRFKKGDLILCASFGAGFTWGATLIRWAY